MFAEIGRMLSPLRSQRCITATCVSQQLTHRLQRLETNTIVSSGIRHGSMSSYGPSVS
ncbi:MAG: hypothetical protein D6741_08860 [Planctomycetota bacterium]|nr:MAG: hypothetical protein D6741_08860 [Planctomycetota bacterium]